MKWLASILDFTNLEQSKKTEDETMARDTNYIQQLAIVYERNLAERKENQVEDVSRCATRGKQQDCCWE